jgi:hypothetical protein
MVAIIARQETADPVRERICANYRGATGRILEAVKSAVAVAALYERRRRKQSPVLMQSQTAAITLMKSGSEQEFPLGFMC